MNSFTRVARTATTLGLAGALALGAASTAHAATPTDAPNTKASTQADGRMQGQFILADRAAFFYGIDANLTAGTATNNPKPIELAQARAITVTVPAVNTVGKIMYDGNCLGSATPGSTTPAWVGCTSSTALDFTVYSDGYVTSTLGALNIANSGGVGSTSYLYLNQRSNPVHKLDLASFAPEAADTTPVAITGPTAGQTVTTKRPVVTGTGEPGASVSVVTQSGKNLGTVIVGADGNWTLTPDSDIANAKPTLTVTQTATDGSTTTATVAFTIDVASPLSADVSFPADVTRQATIGGAGENGATVEVTSGGATIGSAVVATGTWSMPIPTSIGAGTHSFTVTQRVGGKVTGTVEVSKDFGAAVSAMSSITGSTATISGAGVTGARVVVTEGGRQVGTATVANGAYSIPVTGVTAGSHTYTVTQTAPGNIVTTATTTATRGSAITVTNPTNPAAGYTPNTAFTFTGTAPKTAGNLTIRNSAGTLIATVPVNPTTGTWEWTRTNMGTSTWRLTFITGEGTASEEKVTLGAFAPNASQALKFTNPTDPAAGYVANTAFTFRGTALPGAKVQLTNVTGLVLANLVADPNGNWAWTRSNMGTSTWKVTATADKGTPNQQTITLGDFAPRSLLTAR